MKFCIESQFLDSLISVATALKNLFVGVFCGTIEWRGEAIFALQMSAFVMGCLGSLHSTHANSKLS